MTGNTRITYGGFIDVDAHLTDLSDGDIAPTSIARDFYIPGATPVGGTGDSEPDFVGRYIGLKAVNGAVATATSDLEPIPVVGGLLAWRQHIGGGRRFNLGVSALQADNDVALTGLSATRSVASAFGALMIPLARGVTLSGELLFGERELEDGTSGSITRATVSTKYTV